MLERADALTRARLIGVLLLTLALLIVQRSGENNAASAPSERSDVFAVELAPRIPFDWDSFFARERRGKARVDSWTEVIEQGHGDTYRALMESIVDGTITPDAFKAFAAIIDEPHRLAAIERALSQLNGPQQTEPLRTLYQQLMRAAPHPGVLYDYLQDTIDEGFQRARARPATGRARHFAWTISSACYAALIAYERTGERRFLDLVADAMERVIAERDSEFGHLDEVRGRIMHAWGGTSYRSDQKYLASFTTMGRVSFILTVFADVVQRDPHLADYQPLAARFLEAARRAVDDFQMDYRVLEELDEGYYVDRTRDAVEPLNHMAWAGNALILLHELTGEEAYGRQAEQLARYFRHSMWTDRHRCLVWRYDPPPGDRQAGAPERIWKAGVTVQFPLFAYERGLVFSHEDMEMIARTFMTNIHRGHGRFSAFIYEQFMPLERYGESRGGRMSIARFLPFAQFDPRIRQVIESLVAGRPDQKGWFRGTYTIFAYACRLEKRQNPVSARSDSEVRDRSPTLPEHHRMNRRGGAKTAEEPRSSAMRRSWLYFALRSLRQGAPVLI